MNDQTEQATTSPESPQISVWRGGHSLAVTFWVWGVMGSIFLGFIIAAAVNISESTPTLNICALAFEFYTVFVAIATFAAANREKNAGAWKVIAQLVALGWICLISFAFLYFMAMINSSYPNH